MFTENTRDIIMDAIEEHGWLDSRENAKLLEEKKRLAKNVLMLVDSPEKVAKAIELPVDIVAEIAKQMQKHPVCV